MMKLAPIFFKRNRVGRVYTGGRLFHGFFGDADADGFFPEEWIASSVRALNENAASEREGVSVIAETGEYFDSLIARAPVSMLGSQGRMRILVKILDSAVRLPAQAHPDKAFSRKHFASDYGKTEAWIVLDKRENARIYFGFKDGVDRSAFVSAIDESESDKNAMERLMVPLTPEVGDVFLVPARTVHAIGAGCLILEVQEPTDFTIQPEHWCDEYRLSDREMYLGLSREDALGCFDFGKAPVARRASRVENASHGVTVERLIDDTDTDCFVINRIKLDGGEYRLSLPDSYGVYIVTKGTGSLLGDGYAHALKKGDYFFMPATLMNLYTVTGRLEIVECC